MIDEHGGAILVRQPGRHYQNHFNAHALGFLDAGLLHDPFASREARGGVLCKLQTGAGAGQQRDYPFSTLSPAQLRH